MKNEQFELTAERKKQLKEIKKNNVMERTLFVALSPVIIAGILLRSPFVATKAALKAKDAGAKEAVKAGAKGLVKSFTYVSGIKKIYAEGTDRLNEAKKSFYEEDLKKARAAEAAKAEKARKEAQEKAEAKRKEEAKKQEIANRAAAKEKGIPAIADSIANAVKVESVVDNSVCMGYMVYFDNGVEMRVIAKDGMTSAKLKVFNKKDKYEINLSDYEYRLLAGKAIDKKTQAKAAANRKKTEAMLALLNQRVK